MPDITMCQSETCPLRGECYRNRLNGIVSSNWHRSYVMEPARFWVRGETEDCEGHMKVWRKT